MTRGESALVPILTVEHSMEVGIGAQDGRGGSYFLALINAALTFPFNEIVFRQHGAIQTELH
jgi:hypothetical protein